MPAVYNIPAGHSFAESLAQGILDQAGSDPLALSSFTI